MIQPSSAFSSSLPGLIRWPPVCFARFVGFRSNSDRSGSLPIDQVDQLESERRDPVPAGVRLGEFEPRLGGHAVVAVALLALDGVQHRVHRSAKNDSSTTRGGRVESSGVALAGVAAMSATEISDRAGHRTPMAFLPPSPSILRS